MIRLFQLPDYYIGSAMPHRRALQKLSKNLCKIYWSRKLRLRVIYFNLLFIHFTEPWINQDLHCVPSVIKLFFRELPEPLCTEKVWPLLKNGLNMATLNSDSRDALPYFKQALNGLNLAPYRVLKHLMLHLQRVSERSEETGTVVVI